MKRDTSLTPMLSSVHWYSTTLFRGRRSSKSLDRGIILLSQSLADELNDVLGREKFNRYITMEERERFLESLIGESRLVDITETVRVCRDPKDDRVPEVAVNGNA